MSTPSAGALTRPWPQSIPQPFAAGHHTRVLPGSQPGTSHRGHHVLLWECGRWCCTARLGGGSSSPWSCSWGCLQGALAPTWAHPVPALVTPGAATTNTSSLVTCSPVFELLGCHGPCRTGSRCSQLSGWWLTQQPTVWFVERLWCVLLVPGSGRCAFPLQVCPSIARALFLTSQQLLYHNWFGQGMMANAVTGTGAQVGKAAEDYFNGSAEAFYGGIHLS